MSAAAHASPRFKLLLAVCALSPFLLSLMAQFRAPVPQPLSIAPLRPSLVFQQYMLRPFVPEPRAVVNARFRFVNEGRETVRIGEIERSCGCLGQKISDPVVEPGESGEILLQVQTASESPGLKEFWAIVHFTDPEPRQVKLTMKVNIPEHQVSVQPKALLFYQLGTEPVTQQVTVIDSRLQSLNVTDVECSSPLIQVGEVRSIRQRDRVEHVLEVVVPGEVPPGQHRAILTFHTDDFAFPQIVVPIFVHGPASQASDQFQISPEILRVARQSDERQSYRVTVTRESLNPPLVIQRAECSVPEIETEIAATVKSSTGQVASITLVIPAGTTVSGTRGLLNLTLEGVDNPVSLPLQVVAGKR